MPRIDLHTHTNQSDGTLSPTELVGLAAEAGLAAVALTDHDTTAGLEEAHEAAGTFGIEVIDACEISTRIPEGSVHVLAYGFDPADGDLQAHLAGVRQCRETRNLAIARRLHDLGLPLDYEKDVVRHAEGRIVARPHFARAMLERGHVESLRQAYTEYIGDDGPAYVLGDMPHPTVAIRVVRAAGGVTALAHPRQIRVAGRESYARLFGELHQAGLDAVEVDHPSHDARHRRLFTSLAEQFGLIRTGGTDYHGANKPYISIGRGDGTVNVPYETWERLRERRDTRGRA